MRGPTLAALLLSAPAGAAAPDADGLASLFSLGWGEEPRFEQSLEIEGCQAVVRLAVFAEPDGPRRLVERSRFQIQHYEPAGEPLAGVMELTARRYFSKAGDRGIRAWLDAIAATVGDEDRSARLREIQVRVELGEFGRFAALNGYESRSYLEGDVEPYYALPLPVVGLRLPEPAEAAVEAWQAYASERCSR